jgi:diketogulonate reductase-like aldo/keto reductase
MPRIIRLSDGKQIPALAWGNGSSGLLASGEMASSLGAIVLRAGITHIDTAQVRRLARKHVVRCEGLMLRRAITLKRKPASLSRLRG